MNMATRKIISNEAEPAVYRNWTGNLLVVDSSVASKEDRAKSMDHDFNNYINKTLLGKA